MEKKMTHELVGKVVSTKNNKTITVLVETHKMHQNITKELNHLKSTVYTMKQIKQK